MSKKATETGLPLSDSTDSSGPGAELAPIVKAEVVPVDASPAGVLQMINNAMEKGHDPDTMGKLYDLYKTMKADAARDAYHAAMLNLQNSCPTIAKNAQGQFGPYSSYDYAVSVVKPHAQRNGLSWSFQHADSKEGHMRLNMTIRHTGGHSETFHGPEFPISPANKGTNAQQGVCSAETYAMRRVFLAGFGLATGKDTDGGGNGGNFITEDQAATLEALLDETKADRAKFLRFAKVDQMAHIPQSQYRKLVHLLEAKR